MSDFSFRPLLQEVTAVTNERGYDPYEAYAWFYEQAARKGIIGKTYASTSITSGGHARDKSLEMQHIIARNTESARLLAEQLVADRQIDAGSTIEPVFVGKTHWNQGEYMEFWLTVIAGARLSSRSVSQGVMQLRRRYEEAFKRAEVDHERLNSHASAKHRAKNTSKWLLRLPKYT